MRVGFVGVFPKDVWRVVLHHVIGMTSYRGYGYPGHYGRFHVLFTRRPKVVILSAGASELLWILSLIHPVIRSILKEATMITHAEFRIKRLC